MSKNKDDGIFIDLTTSCTVDNAVRYLLGIGPSSSNDLTVSELADVDTLESALLNIYEHVEVNYSNAKFENEPDDVIAARLEKLNKAKLLIDNASRYKRDIIDELGKGNNSILKSDPTANSNLNTVHITITSLNKWALKRYGICLSENSAKLKPLEQSEKPWLIQEPNDPPPLQPWYTAARYFARQLIISDSTLGEKRNLLVIKIAKEFTNVGIFKRGKKKYLSPDTIRKALSSIELK